MKTKFKIFTLIAACGSMLIVDQTRGQVLDVKITYGPNGKVVEKTVDIDAMSAIGASNDNPIIFQKIKNYNALKIEQDNYIRKLYEGYNITGNFLTINKSGRIIQDLMLQNKDGKCQFVYFDVDDVLRKYKKLDDKKMAERIKELLEKEKASKTHENNPYKIPKDKP